MSQFVWWFQALLLKTSSSLPSKYFPRQKPSIFNLSNFPTIIRALFVRFNPIERLEQRSVSLNRPWARGTRTGSMSVTMSGMMLSPKMQRMQRSVRINDGQLLGLAEKARYDSRLSGYLYKRSSDNSKWLLRWFRLYQVRACADWNIWMEHFLKDFEFKDVTGCQEIVIWGKWASSIHIIHMIRGTTIFDVSWATAWNWILLSNQRWLLGMVFVPTMHYVFKLERITHENAHIAVT